MTVTQEVVWNVTEVLCKRSMIWYDRNMSTWDSWIKFWLKLETPRCLWSLICNTTDNWLSSSRREDRLANGAYVILSSAVCSSWLMGEIIIYSFENEPILVWERWYHLAREQNPPKAQNRNFFNSSPIMTNLFIKYSNMTGKWIDHFAFAHYWLWF